MADLPGKRVRLPGPATSSQRLAIRIQTSAADELVALDPTSSDPRTDDLAVPVLDADDELADLMCHAVLMAHRRDTDIGAAITRKWLTINSTT
jgi:hypothetical protein